MINSSQRDPLCALSVTALSPSGFFSCSLHELQLSPLLLLVQGLSAPQPGARAASESESRGCCAHMSCDCCIDSWCVVGYHEV